MADNSETISKEDIQQFFSLVEQSSRGLSDVDLQIALPEVTTVKRVKIINSLLSANKIILFNQAGKLVYRVNTAATSSQSAKGADNEERLVVRIIEEAGNKGIWMRDIRIKSNLSPTQLNKVLKALEGKKIIKAVKSVSAIKKKVYMLYNLEPDKSLTGGAWYSDQDFEGEFVKILGQQCHRFLVHKRDTVQTNQYGPIEARNMSYATSNDIWKYISQVGVSKVQLSVEDIETVLDTIVYDGKIEKVVSADLTKRYRAIEPLLPLPGLAQTPCGVCPIIKFCSNLGDVTPQKCEYIKEWLDL